MSGPSSLAWLGAIEDAVSRLSRHRIGAVMIVADAATGLLDDGVVVGARATAALTVTLAIPDGLNELSKGAIVIRDGIIERAAVPVLRTPGWEWVGVLAREISASVVAVSEEDGVVRIGERTGATVTVEPSSLAHRLAEGLRFGSSAPDSLQPILEVLKGTFRQLTDEIVSRERCDVGVPTGLDRYDRLTGGLHRGEVTIFAGANGLGANMLALQIAANIARDAKLAADSGAAEVRAGVLVLSPSLTPNESALRMLGAVAGERKDALEWVKLSDRAAALASSPIWLDASPSLSVTGLMDRIQRVRRRLGDDDEPLVVVCIPDLFLLGDGETLWGRADSHDHIASALKVVARDLDVPILAGVRILGEGDDGRISTELRMLEASVDRLAVLHRHWRDGREIHMELRGRRGNRGLTLWTTAEGGFSDRPDRGG